MAKLVYDKNGRLIFTKEMKKEYTILLPMMAKIHFSIIRNVFTHYGYKNVLLEDDGPEIAQVGLKYVHNDTCYPAILVIGQFIHALQSGKYDINKTALMITQTGGGCRASNYIHLLRKALVKAGFENVPVISLNLSGLEKNSGFSITIPMIRRFLAGLVYGDALMLFNNQTKAYEVNKGESDALVQMWIDKLSQEMSKGDGFSGSQLEKNLDKIAADFAEIKLNKVDKIKVGIVGEIYVKYSSLGNNNLEKFLLEQGCEVNVPGIMGFALFKIDNRLEDYKLYGGSKLKFNVLSEAMKYLTKMESYIINSAKNHGFLPPSSYAHTKELIKGMIGYGNKMGEGWLLTAEMAELIESGYENIVCTQPFGCLPNHICAKGMISSLKRKYENANIFPVDYDPGAPRVNQANRIKLMLAVAKEKMKSDKQVSKVEDKLPVAK